MKDVNFEELRAGIQYSSFDVNGDTLVVAVYAFDSDFIEVEKALRADGFQHVLCHKPFPVLGFGFVCNCDVFFKDGITVILVCYDDIVRQINEI